MELNSWSGPQHEVRIAKSFAVGKTEVTFAEWDACVAAGACSRASDTTWGRDDRPVINVSWDDAKQYIVWLSRITGKDYRLLAEAEWEYAARAGSETRFSFGDDETQLDQHAWYSRNSGGKSQPVGKKRPNAFGLHDMHGNVSEWVEDPFHGSYEGAPADGSPWVKDGVAGWRVVRGGFYLFDPRALRAAWRNGFPSGTPISRFPVGQNVKPLILHLGKPPSWPAAVTSINQRPETLAQAFNVLESGESNSGCVP